MGKRQLLVESRWTETLKVFSHHVLREPESMQKTTQNNRYIRINNLQVQRS